ncbi:hypothetical protein QBC39DRAFT_109434 [Podospora conica]|nr:hypothetical protein QBC39DRAFT_109434 [Schizothecium conicum]
MENECDIMGQPTCQFGLTFISPSWVPRAFATCPSSEEKTLISKLPSPHHPHSTSQRLPHHPHGRPMGRGSLIRAEIAGALNARLAPDATDGDGRPDFYAVDETWSDAPHPVSPRRQTGGLTIFNVVAGNLYTYGLGDSDLHQPGPPANPKVLLSSTHEAVFIHRQAWYSLPMPCSDVHSISTFGGAEYLPANSHKRLADKQPTSPLRIQLSLPRCI